MSPSVKRIIAFLVLTIAPVLGVYQAKQSAWGKFVATPKARQMGEPTAKVVLVEYSDFQCPMCARMGPILHEFADRYKGQVRLAYKYFPLVRIHRNAMASAHAAECAADQNQFWPYQNRLFATQLQWSNLADPTTTYMALAQEVQLDTAKFSACFADPSKVAVIEQDRAEGESRQINATPTLFVNDERLVGQFIESDGARIIEREIRRSK